MSTQSSREQYIQKALTASREQYRVPFRGGLVLQVIEVPLSLPVLNASSFRIAPDLEDHPQFDQVMADPDTDASQEIVAGLVRKAHRQAEKLKESLINGQHYPGVITRSGKLINANTRCVLMRELYADGKIQTDRLQVAVLPVNFAAPDELQLESVLQQQREYKDEYNFVSELMMLRKLSQEAGLSDAQIAAQQERGKSGAKEVRELREILDLMERARRLQSPLVPISRFVTDEGQKENWKAIHQKVRAQDRLGNTAGADEILRAFLVNTYLGSQAVHKGARHIHPEWVNTDLMNALKASVDDVSQAVVEHIEQVAADPEPEVLTPVGVDLLGDLPETLDPSVAVGSATLSLVHEATTRRDAELTLATGRTVSADDVVLRFRDAAKRAFVDADRREEAGSRLDRPGNYLSKALKDLKDASTALADVIGEEEFEPRLEQVEQLVDELRVTLGRVVSVLADDAADRE